ncbi:hypothetical protein ACLB1O_23445 [Escherichia coli]
MLMKCVLKPSVRVFKPPAWPTTTIGSFPQTTEIRTLRLDLKRAISTPTCTAHGALRNISSRPLLSRDVLGLDVLVHGEAERNDMVEYFGEHLDGFVFTQSGWVDNA